MKGRKHQPLTTGTRYGRLSVLRFIGINKSGHANYLCRCDCGNECAATASNLRCGNTQSCGCLWLEKSREASAKRRIVSDSPRDPVVALWRSIIHRCHNPKSWAYHRYGGRGIKVCNRWRKSFHAFAKDMGPRPGSGYSVDRIDNDGDYKPSNCRWSTKREQARNTSRNVYLTCDGRTQLMVEWAEETGIPLKTIWHRLEKGWTHEQAVMTSVRRGSG